MGDISIAPCILLDFFFSLFFQRFILHFRISRDFSWLMLLRSLIAYKTAFIISKTGVLTHAQIIWELMTRTIPIIIQILKTPSEYKYTKENRLKKLFSHQVSKKKKKKKEKNQLNPWRNEKKALLIKTDIWENPDNCLCAEKYPPTHRQIYRFIYK